MRGEKLDALQYKAFLTIRRGQALAETMRGMDGLTHSLAPDSPYVDVANILDVIRPLLEHAHDLEEEISRGSGEGADNIARLRGNELQDLASVSSRSLSVTRALSGLDAVENADPNDPRYLNLAPLTELLIDQLEKLTDIVEQIDLILGRMGRGSSPNETAPAVREVEHA